MVEGTVWVWCKEGGKKDGKRNGPILDKGGVEGTI